MVSRTSCMSRGFVFHFSLFLNYLNWWLQDVSAGGCEKTKSKAKEIAESLWVPRLPRCAKFVQVSSPGGVEQAWWFHLRFDDFWRLPKLFKTSSSFSSFRRPATLLRWSMHASPGLNASSFRSNDVLWWMNQRWIDDELRTFPTLTDVQSFDCDVIHLHLAFSFPWRVPFFCKFFKGLRKRYLTWLVRVALCPSVLICKIRMIRAFIGACQCGRSDCCDLVLRWSRVSHWDLFSVTWNFIFLTVTQLQREVVQKNIEVVKRCKELIF
jgi:hypothetical protein